MRARSDGLPRQQRGADVFAQRSNGVSGAGAFKNPVCVLVGDFEAADEHRADECEVVAAESFWVVAEGAAGVP
jgi:hypothetical protein